MVSLSFFLQKTEKKFLTEIEKLLKSMETMVIESATKSQNLRSTVLSDLDLQGGHTENVVEKSITDVLSHTVIQKHFLGDSGAGGTDKLGMLISKFVAKFLQQLGTMSRSSNMAEKVVEMYLKKCEEVLVAGNNMKYMDTVISILNGIVNTLPCELCAPLLDSLLRISTTNTSQDLSGDVQDELPVMALVLKLMNILQKSSLKLVKLSKDSFNNLVDMFQIHSRHIHVLECFCQRFPHLAVLLTTSRVETMLSTADCKTLLLLLMKHNVTLTLHLCDLVSQGQIKVKANLELVTSAVRQLLMLSSEQGRYNSFILKKKQKEN